MLGAIAGDIIGSTYEIINKKKKDINLYPLFSRYTDDTVLTIATADCLLHDGDFGEYYRKYTLRNQMRGYGSRFYFWAMFNKRKPYNSMGNGSAMRVSPVAYVAKNIEQVMSLAKQSAEVTHNHIEGIKGAQAIACAIYLSLQNTPKEEIKNFIEETFEYDLGMSYKTLQRTYKGGTTCPLTVPQSIICFLDSKSFEDAIRNAISIGGDSDTIACMTGSIAEAYYSEIPEYIVENTLKKISPRFQKVIQEFKSVYGFENHNM